MPTKYNKDDLRHHHILEGPRKNKKRKGTIRHEAFKAQQTSLHKKKMRKIRIEQLKESRKLKW